MFPFFNPFSARVKGAPLVPPSQPLSFFMMLESKVLWCKHEWLFDLLTLISFYYSIVQSATFQKIPTP